MKLKHLSVAASLPIALSGILANVNSADAVTLIPGSILNISGDVQVVSATEFNFFDIIPASAPAPTGTFGDFITGASSTGSFAGLPALVDTNDILSFDALDVPSLTANPLVSIDVAGTEFRYFLDPDTLFFDFSTPDTVVVTADGQWINGVFQGFGTFTAQFPTGTGPDDLPIDTTYSATLEVGPPVGVPEPSSLAGIVLAVGLGALGMKKRHAV